MNQPSKAPGTHKICFDFALWDFCPWVRTARPSVALGPTFDNLEDRNPSHRIPSMDTILEGRAMARKCSEASVKARLR
jgi:hypothetical protein